MEKTTLYPEIDVIKTSGTAITLLTHIRHLHEGKWYLQVLTRDGVVRSNADMITELSIFHNQVYLALNLTIVDLESTDLFGDSAFQLDPNQESEKERLIKIIDIVK